MTECLSLLGCSKGMLTDDSLVVSKGEVHDNSLGEESSIHGPPASPRCGPFGGWGPLMTCQNLLLWSSILNRQTSRLFG